MLKPLNSIARIVLTAFGLASYTLAQGSSLPETSYEIDTGDLLDGAPYISNFECLVFGENLFKQQACLYYKASVSDLLTSGKTSKEICFKDAMTVSKPRDFISETNLRIVFETTPNKPNYTGHIAGATSIARIISNEPVNKTAPHGNRWHETTTVALYDCAVPLTASATKTELALETDSAAKTPSATDQELWKNPPLAADQSLPHGLALLPGTFVVYDPDQLEQPDREKSVVVKVPSASGHQSWWSEQYVQQLETLGWSNMPGMPPPIQMLNRQKGQCREQMALLALGPNSHNSSMLKGSDMPILEFHAVAFAYSNSGACETE